MSAASDNLRTNQGQLDMDGVEVRVSRQAVCETLEQHAELLAAAKEAKKYLEPNLVEPGRTVFWRLVEAITKAEGGA